MDAVFDSVSVATTFKGELTKKGIIFCSISEAIQNHSELVKKYLGSVIPITDHYFCNIKFCSLYGRIFRIHTTKCKMSMELSTYFRINASQTGQFERTLIIADKGEVIQVILKVVLHQ